MKYKRLLIFETLVVLAISSCGSKVVVPSDVKITISDVGDNLTIHTDRQKELLEADDPAALIDNNTASYGNRSSSAPLSISFSWEETNDIDQAADKYSLYISENADLSDPIVFDTTDSKYNVSNLKVNTKYYYSVISTHGTASFLGDKKEFTINDVAPRNFNIEGVENCRDLGGWDIGNNRTYKQGMIYRTGQFNYGGANTFVSEPTEKGKHALLDELKIKTEIDLRKTETKNDYDEVNGITSSPLGNSVNYVSAPMVYEGMNIFTQEINRESLMLFFDTLADESNYPIAFHCLRGTDRTGALAYVLGALVGMNEDDLMLDYLFSDLAKIGTPVRASSISGEDFYVYGIANSEGTTLSEKTKNYLISTVGVESSTLDQIISILVDE